MNSINYFLKHVIMMNGLKNHMKNLEKSNDKHEKENFVDVEPMTLKKKEKMEKD